MPPNDHLAELLTPYRLRSVRIGIRMTLLVALMLGAFVALPGHGRLTPVFYPAFIVTAVLGAGLVAALPWPRLFRAGWGVRFLYAWSCLDIALITLGIALSGGPASEHFYIYGVTTIFFAASYPPRGQAGLFAFTALCYTALVVVSADRPEPAVLTLRFGLLGLIWQLAQFLSRELMREMVGHGEAYAEAERRAALLARVAAAIGRSNALVPEEALSAVVDGVMTLGFECAAIELFDDDAITFQVLEARGLPNTFAHTTHPTSAGIPGLMLRDRRTVSLENYSDYPSINPEIRALGIRGVVASPIWSRGRLAAALIGGSKTRESFTSQEIEAFELLAAHAGRAMENAGLAQDLRRSEARFRSLVQHAHDIVAVIGATGEQRYVSPSARRVMGYTPEELLAVNAFTLAHPDDVSMLAGTMSELLASPGATLPLEARVRYADGSWHWHEITATNLLHEPSVGGIVVNHRDVTERKAFQEQLRRQAFHDALTGLPNRASFMRSVEQALARSRELGDGVAVLLLDLDRFKNVNDSLGHATGDQLLQEVASRLVNAITPDCLLARLGGDEFTILIEHVLDPAVAVSVGERVIAALSVPVRFLDYETAIGASVGIALGTAATASADDLLSRADLAMYEAKERGRGQWALFDAQMGARARARLELESDLRLALERDELCVHYQPVVSLEDGSITGVEALLRWQHPARGMIPPADFIPLAEETGLIVPMGRWVLEEACRTAQQWVAALGPDSPAHVGVNVSARQFQQPSFAREVADILTRTGLDPRRLRLEITESVLMDDAGHAMTALARLKRMGVMLVMDDFGTGYSSLSYIRRYPIDVLKIDKSFIDPIDGNAEAQALVEAIVNLGHSLRLTMVAEGIERAEQVRELKALGCDTGQGYCFFRPLPPEELLALLGRRAASDHAQPLEARAVSLDQTA